MPILPLRNSGDVYGYSDAILKHMPEKLLKTFDDTILYSKKMLHYQVIEIEDFTIETIMMTELTKSLQIKLQNFKI